jgi:hypothetical protein
MDVVAEEVRRRCHASRALPGGASGGGGGRRGAVGEKEEEGSRWGPSGAARQEELGSDTGAAFLAN